MNVDEPHEECATTIKNNDMHLFNRGESWLGEADAEVRIFSVKYNRRTYADLEAGDIVDTPDGEARIRSVIGVDQNLFEVIHLMPFYFGCYQRHELILLEKRND
jgi:hypothetical protein